MIFRTKNPHPLNILHIHLHIKNLFILRIVRKTKTHVWNSCTYPIILQTRQPVNCFYCFPARPFVSFSVSQLVFCLLQVVLFCFSLFHCPRFSIVHLHQQQWRNIVLSHYIAMHVHGHTHANFELHIDQHNINIIWTDDHVYVPVIMITVAIKIARTYDHMRRACNGLDARVQILCSETKQFVMYQLSNMKFSFIER